MKKNSKKTKFNIKDFLIKNKKNILIYGGIFLLVIVCILLVKFFILDNGKYASIKYQVYDSNNNISTYKKDGQIIKTDTPIKGLKFIVNSKYYGVVYVDISNTVEKKRCYDEDICSLEQGIEKISFDLTETLKKKYDIYYRIYSNNKWSNWGHNSETIGVDNEAVTKLQLKFVPKNAYLGDYLEGYEVIDNE